MTTPDTDLHTAIWRDLREATTRRTGFTLAWLATQHPDDGPQVRAMILRRADPATGSLRFATDTRSRKCAAIAADPRVAVTVHDPDAGIQVRLTGRAVLVDDAAERDAAWTSLAPHTRASYPSPDRFGWLRVDVDRVDHLDLAAPDGHLRRVLRRGDGWRVERVEP